MISIKRIIKEIALLLMMIVVFGTLSKSAYASNLTIKTKNVNMKIASKKKHSFLVYYKGKNVTKYCDIKVKSKKKIVPNINYGESDIQAKVCNNKIKLSARKIGKEKIKVVVKFKPYMRDELLYDVDYYDDDDDLEDDYMTDYDEEFEKSSDGYINHPFFGKISESEYYKTYTATKSIKVKVSGYKKLSAKATLDLYSTRLNSFCMTIKNLSKKTITVYSQGASVVDKDYSSFDRDVKIEFGKKTVKIKPGKTKTIWFDVIGKPTWYDVKDFSLVSYWKYGGKKHEIWVDAKGYTWEYSRKKANFCSINPSDDDYYLFW